MINDCEPVSLPAPVMRSRACGLLAGGTGAIAAASALAGLHMSDPLADDQIRWGAIALAVLCAGLLLVMSAAAGHDGLGLGTWRMGSLSLAWAALAFGLATITWLGPQGGPAAELRPGSIVRGLWLIAVAMIMLTAGYCAGPYRLASRPVMRVADMLTRRFTSEIRGPAVPWALFAAGLTAKLAFVTLTGRFGYVGDAAGALSSASGYGQYLAIAGQCVPLSVAAATIWAYQGGQIRAWLSLGALFTAAVAIGAVSGSKGTFVVAILAVIIPRAAVRRGFPAKAVAAAAAFSLLVVVPFNAAYRATARGAVTLTAGQAVAAAPAIAGQVLATDVTLSVLPQSAGFVAQRVRAIDGPAIIAQRTPGEIPYISPVRLVTSPVIDLIPRIIWPGKPILAAGYQVSQQYYRLPPQLLTSSAITPEGDLYRHGGWLPLLAGMFVLGTGIRALDRVTDLRRGAHGTFLIILLFPAIVEAESDWATMLAGIPSQLLLWIVVVSLSFARRTA